jgi:hypothetical protein
MINSLLYLNKFIYLANAGIPLFTQSIFYQFYLLIPIIAIEAYTHKKILKLSIAKAIYISSVTNVFSTVVGGVLILFFGVFAGQILFRTSVPVQPGAFPFLPLEIIVTLVPMFFISVFMESLLVIIRLKEIEKSKAKKSFLVANAFTYFMLVILAVTQLIKGYVQGRG